jgi:thioredoxin reductase (NADPH)
MPAETGGCEIVVIGGGPAAMAAAIYAGRAGRCVKVLERGVVGGQSALTYDIANYPGFPDGIGGTELADRMRRQAETFGAAFLAGEASAVQRLEDGSFRVCLREECLSSEVVIVATGSDPRRLEVPGEAELRGRGVSYCATCDGPFFRDKRVVVVGGGDSALKEALHLAKFASAITIVHRRDAFRAEHAYRAEVKAHPAITVRWNAVVREIRGEKTVTGVLLEDTATGRTEELPTDGVFIFIGTEPNTRFLCPILEADCGGHVETGPDMQTSVPGLFAVGDVRKHSYRQIATAVGEGATAAIAADHYLNDRHRRAAPERA